MTPRPIHKWKTFWLGILVILCLLGGWKRSYKYQESVGISFGAIGPRLLLQHGNSCIGLFWDPIAPKAGLHTASIKAYPRKPAFRGLVYYRSYPGGEISLSIAYWYVILLFTLIWTTFLAARSRRIRLLTKAKEETATAVYQETGTILQTETAPYIDPADKPPRPLYQWKAFWLGLILLICLFAAWRHSTHRRGYTGFNFTKNGPSIIVGQGGGKITIAFQNYDYSPGPHVLSRTTYLGQSPFGTASSFITDPREVILTFAHWFVILIYTLCWSIYLASRRERTRTLTESRTAATKDAATQARITPDS